VLAGDTPPGRSVLVYDCEGYFMGVGMAELLAARGVAIRLVTPLSVVAPFLDRTLEGRPVRELLAALGVELETDTRLVQVVEGGALLRRYGVERVVEADGVVLVTARRSDDRLYRTLLDDPGPLEAVYAIGDCVAPRLIADCVFDGHRLAREIDSPHPARPLPYLRERRLIATVDISNVSA
jgi:dimethylamine/trimethylamine dehydrogenase